MFFFFCVFVGSAGRLGCLCLWSVKNLLGFGVILELCWLWERGFRFGRFLKEETFLLICFCKFLFVEIIVLCFKIDSSTTDAYDLKFVGVVCFSVLTKLLIMVLKNCVIGICCSFLLCLAFLLRL